MAGQNLCTHWISVRSAGRSTLTLGRICSWETSRDAQALAGERFHLAPFVELCKARKEMKGFTRSISKRKVEVVMGARNFEPVTFT